MRVLLINSVCGIGSTGRICAELAQEFEAQGDEVKIAYGRDGKVPEQYKKYAVRIGTDLDVRLHGMKSRLLDAHGLGSVQATKKFLKWADAYRPELLWLHNIHGYYINYELLFAWIKKYPEMEVKWTLHDCWAFTGHCSHFSALKCYRWKTHCFNCPQKKRYPASVGIDCSSHNYYLKKQAFTGVNNMTIITPSKWLADLVKQSFLKVYPVEVKYNIIDTSVFKPTPSNFRERYGLQGKILVLGVASTWDDRKGLNDFLEMSHLLDDNYRIVLVGLNKAQLTKLPSNVIGICRTENVKRLAEIYTAADVFVNPSKEETFGLTTVEAKSCGTNVIVYKGTACEEIAAQYGGIVVNQGVHFIIEALKDITIK